MMLQADSRLLTSLYGPCLKLIVGAADAVGLLPGRLFGEGGGAESSDQQQNQASNLI